MNPLSSLTITSLFNRSVRDFSTMPAVGYVGETHFTYKEFGEHVKHCSDVLVHCGVAPGDRVAIIGESSPYWGIAYFAITTMGCVAVPILPDFHTTEIHHIIRHAECSAIFVSERLSAKLDDIDRSPFLAFIIS